MPKRASDDGGLFGTPTNSVGEYGAISGPNTATSTISRTIPAPIRVRVIFSARLRMPSHGRFCTTDGPGPCGTPPSSARSTALSTVWLIASPS